MDFREVAEAPLGPQARVYEHGWQSWTPTGVYAATATSPRAPDARSQTVHYRPRTTLPQRGFQAAGLLALDPGDGGPVRLWSAPAPEREVPNIRAHAENGWLRVSADGEVEETSSGGSLWSALESWAEGLAQRAGVTRVPTLAPGWCTWYQYFTEVREEDVLENLAAMR